ncbi:type II secretion system F family protein [Clostridia bacterium]|nr:type II secretion system F family protein [Clostridia bacterium]
MKEYVCKVKRPNGTIIRKYKIRANSKQALLVKLKQNDLYLLEYEEVVAKKDIFGGNKIRLSTKDIAMFCRQLSSLLASGVSLVNALNILYLQIDKRNIKKSIKLLYESVQRGDQFSESIKKQSDVYPEIMVRMIEAGEMSGNLDEVITRLAEQFEKDVKLKTKIQTAMTYPIILVLLSISVILILVTQVFPIFLGLYDTATEALPFPTQVMIGFSDFIQNYWYVMIIGVILVVLAAKTFIGTEYGKRKWHTLLFKLPAVGKTLTKIAAVRFSRTLSTLLSSGTTLIQSLDVVINVVGNRVIMDDLLVTKEDIRKGMMLSQSLRKVTYLPPMIYSMVGIGEESGTMEHMLLKCAEYYDDEVDASIQKLVTMIEPLLIIVMGGIVGFIVISMILPIFNIYQSIG